MMKRINTPGLTLLALSLLALSSTSAIARDAGAEQQNIGSLNAEQQTAVQKIHTDYYTQTDALRQQLMSKRYEYNSLLTASTPDSAKISAVAKEIESLHQALDEQRVKRDIAMAQAGVSRGAGMGYGGCGEGHYGGSGHMGMDNW